MTKEEALNILGVEPNDPPQQIILAYREKWNQFQNMISLAPHDGIRKIYQSNIEKLELIKKSFPELCGEISHCNVSGAGNVRADQQSSESGSVPDTKAGISTPKTDSSESKQIHSEDCAGWLIRHNEGIEDVAFELIGGENCIGRIKVPGKHSILLEDDKHISRYHAIIEAVDSYDIPSFFVSDNGKYNDGKASLNGVFINSNSGRIAPGEKVEIRDGDTIQIGTTKLVLKINVGSKNKDVIMKEVNEGGYTQNVIIDSLRG